MVKSISYNRTSLVERECHLSVLLILVTFLNIILGCASYEQWVKHQQQLNLLPIKYRTIGLIATDDEWDEFLSLQTDEERESFLEKFWKRRDPTPTTEINERRLEHERRVRYAEQHHFKAVGGNFWDDRGRIYIKYGEPDVREIHVEELAQQQPQKGIRVGRDRRYDIHEGATRPWERWYYYRYGLRFDFVEEYNIYKLVADAEIQCGASSRHTTARLLACVPNEKLAEFHEQLKEAPTEIYEPKYGGKHLKSLLDIATFKGEEGKDRVELYYGVPFKQLMTEANEAVLDITAVVFDGKEREIARKEASHKSLVSSTRPDQFLIDQLTFDIPPGDYTLAVRLESKPANRLGIYKLAFKASDYSGKPAISDIQFGSEIILGESKSHFSKNGILIVPYPTKVVSRSSTLNIYYEIYNLALGSDNRTCFSVEYTIRPHKGKEAISMTDIYNKTKFADTPKYLSWDLKDAKPGSYDLIITVEDLNSGKKDTASTTFMLIR